MIIPYKMIAGWMAFQNLTVCTGLTCSYTIGYRLRDKPNEHWTARFTRFKNNERPALYGGLALFRAAVPHLIKHLNLNPNRVAFIPALSSSETTAAPNRALPQIAKICAQECGVQYHNAALTKQVHQKIHTIYDAQDRAAELEKANYQSTKINADHIFVFDDIITRGDTLSHIAQAILTTNQNAKVYGIAFAKSERIFFCPDPNNNQVPTHWDKLWENGEQQCNAKG